MAIETRRGCGYRRAGGIYVVGGVGASDVAWLPFCTPFRQTRSLQWVSAAKLLETCHDNGESVFRQHPRIALCFVGAKHYSVDSFVKEAAQQGVSRRVATIPKDLRPGDPIALAHPQCIPVSLEGKSAGLVDAQFDWHEADHCEACRHVPSTKSVFTAHTTIGRELVRQQIARVKDLAPERVADLEKQLRGVTGWGDPTHVAGVFGLFHMRQVEVVLPQSVASDPDIIRKCSERSVRIVAVPDGDGDHVQPGWKLPRFLVDDEADEPSDVEVGGEEVTASTDDLA